MNQEVTNYLLAYENMKIIQRKDMFNFSLDTVLLANFCSINKNVEKIIDLEQIMQLFLYCYRLELRQILLG